MPVSDELVAWANRMLPGAIGNRDTLHSGYQRVYELWLKADAARDKCDVTPIVEAMLHWVFVFRDIANVEIAILKAFDDDVLLRTLQKTHCVMIYAFLEKWPGMLDSGALGAVRKRFPVLVDASNETKLAFSNFNAKWRVQLFEIRDQAGGHYENAIKMDEIWRGFTLKLFLELITDFRELERPFVEYVGRTLKESEKILKRSVNSRVGRMREALSAIG